MALGRLGGRKLTNNQQRLDKLLANVGIGSRKEVKQLIKSGRVTIDGSVQKDSSSYVDPYSNVVEVDGTKIKYREFIYIMLNKPQGVISATFDPFCKTVIDLLPKEFQAFEPFPVGRLDKDTEGLLLLTNDGKLAHDLLSPKKHVDKVYFAIIDGMVTDEDCDIFNKGVTLDDGYKTLPALLNILESSATSRVEITIQEGKFHQVKRMFEAVDKKVTYLKRISMGPLKLDNSLSTGEFRELTDQEVYELKDEKNSLS
jgi:16S rRNA pseudouridine516 synthase